MRIEADFSEALDINPGTYHVRVVGAEVGVWEKSGTPYVRWELELFGTDSALDGRKMKQSTPAAGKGAFRLKRLYKAAVGEDAPTDGFDTEDVLGKEMTVVVDWGTDKAGNQTDFPEVKSFGSYDESADVGPSEAA